MGKYAISAKVVTVHEGHKVSFAVDNGKSVEVPLAKTAGMGQQT